VHSFCGQVIDFALDVEEALRESAKFTARLVFPLE
jgi:hypothetical protein